MKVQTGYLYHIKDEFFNVVNDESLMTNHERGKKRPTYFTINDKNISKSLGTRHRSAIGISKESDSIVVVVSEETGKISVAKNGTLIADVKEEALYL